MTKVQFSNVCVGTLLDNTDTGLRYRLTERIARRLVLVRVSAVASAPLVVIPRESQAKEWQIVADQVALGSVRV